MIGLVMLWPAAVAYALGLVLGMVFSLGILITLVSAAVAAIGVGIYRTQKFKAVLSALNEAYERQWYCFACGNVFAVESHKNGDAQTSDASRMREEIGAQELTERLYRGQSAAFNRGSSGQRSDYVSRVRQPIQRASRPTARDLSGLTLIIARMTSNRTFEPLNGVPLDKGVASRLASLGLIEYVPERDVFTVTELGLEEASRRGCLSA